jgi:hypothetical protein
MAYNQPSEMKNGTLGAKKKNPTIAGGPNKEKELTKEYETRSRRMNTNVQRQGENTFAPMGVKSTIDPASGKTVNKPKEFNRKVVKDPENDKGYTSVYGEGGKRVFRGKTNSRETENFLKKSETKVKEVNTRRVKNADDLNAVGGDTKTWTKGTERKAKALGNLAR